MAALATDSQPSRSLCFGPILPAEELPAPHPSFTERPITSAASFLAAALILSRWIESRSEKMIRNPNLDLFRNRPIVKLYLRADSFPT